MCQTLSTLGNVAGFVFIENKTSNVDKSARAFRELTMKVKLILGAISETRGVFSGYVYVMVFRGQQISF